MADTVQTDHHENLLLDQLTDERAVKASLEQRGIAIISTSGALVAIVLGFIALATRDPSHPLPEQAALLLIGAMAGLLAASAVGLVMNVPAPTSVLETGYFTDPAGDRQVAIRLRAQMLDQLRRVNRSRARLLIIALSFEVAALALLAASAVATLSVLF